MHINQCVTIVLYNKKCFIKLNVQTLEHLWWFNNASHLFQPGRNLWSNLCCQHTALSSVILWKTCQVMHGKSSTVTVYSNKNWPLLIYIKTPSKKSSFPHIRCYKIWATGISIGTWCVSSLIRRWNNILFNVALKYYFSFVVLFFKISCGGTRENCCYASKITSSCFWKYKIYIMFKPGLNLKW